jgi:F-type H+-transporting ATPase subunit epsilon
MPKMKTFNLEITTQERHVLTQTVTSLTVMTETGQITILADHLPLFSRLKPGELTYVHNGQPVYFAVTGGFVDVSPRNIVTVLADSAVRSDEINLQKSSEAVEKAKAALASSDNLKDTYKIETELRNALLSASVARKRQRTTSQ